MSPGAGGVRAHRSGLRRCAALRPADSRRGKPWRDHRQVWAASCGSCTPVGHGAMCWAVRALAVLPWPAASLAAGWDLAQALGGAGRRRAWLRPGSLRSGRPAGAGGGASDSGARGPDGDAATTTTTAPAALSVASTTPGRPAAAAPPRSRPGPGPNLASLEVVAVLRAQLPPAPAWARTAARNAWATSTRVICRYQASQRRTWE